MILRRFFKRSQEDSELSLEIESHLAHEIDDNLARGMIDKEARRQAYLKFGTPHRIRETVWEANRLAWFEDTWRDFRHAARTLARTPAFTIVALLVMALGIGANTALFTVVRSVLLKPLPFKDPDRLIQLYERSPGGDRPYNYVAGGMYAAWNQQAPSVEQMAIYGTDSINLSGDGGALPEKIRYAECSWNLFSLLGIEPALGRFFTESDDRQEASGTVVLTHSLWVRRYAADPAVIGKTILLDARPYTVIGVLPAWLNYPEARTQLWAPIYHEKGPHEMQAVDNHNFFVLARLRPGATLSQAVSEVDTAEKRVHMDHPNPFVGNAASGRTMLDGVVHDSKTQLYVLLAATSCVLLIACLNVANLLVARSASRKKEAAIRAALGGSRWRLVREQATESVVLAMAGGALGLPLAWLGTRWLVYARPDIARADAIQMDFVAILFGLGMVVASGILAGSIPAMSFLRGPLLEPLQESSRSNSAGLGRARLRKILLAAEVGLTVMLLISAGLLLKSYQRLRSHDLGCTTRNVLTMRFSLPDVRYNTSEKVATFYEQFLSRVRALPGIKTAGIATGLPGQGYVGDTRFSIPEHPLVQKGAMQDALVRAADPGYFQSLQIPLLHGRTFEDRERLNEARSVIVSESFARQYFPNENPLGKHVRALDFSGVPPEGFEIVGVVGNTIWELTEPENPTLYFPLYSGEWTSASVAIRSDQDVSVFALPIQKILAQIDADLPVSDVLTMEQSIGRSTLDASFTSLLVLVFAIIALLLAAVGLYGVLSYLVTQRTGEIGIRIAFGAQREQMLRLMLWDGLRPAWVGLLLGLGGSLLAVQWIRTMLYGTSPLDWTVYAAVALLLLVIAVAACAIPAWRASRLNPMQALRME